MQISENNKIYHSISKQKNIYLVCAIAGGEDAWALICITIILCLFKEKKKIHVHGHVQIWMDIDLHYFNIV